MFEATDEGNLYVWREGPEETKTILMADEAIDLANWIKDFFE